MRKLIRTDGTEQELPGPLPMDELKRLIGAESIDSVNLRHLGWPLQVMLVDDHGHVTVPVETAASLELVSVGHRKPVNAKATALYLANCIPGTTHKIVGDVVIVPDEDFA